MEQPPEPVGHEWMTDEQIGAATVGEPQVDAGPIELADYDPAWPDLFAREAERIAAELAGRVLEIEHVGSTSVPGVAAKPIIDILLVVADSADEEAYAPRLEDIGYVLRIREPDWHEHRMFKGPDDRVNLHVFTEGCPEIERMLLFRNRLRNNQSDRDLYERTKHDLARREWRLRPELRGCEGGCGRGDHRPRSRRGSSSASEKGRRCRLSG